MVEEELTMEWFYDIVHILWDEDNKYVTIAVTTFIIGILHGRQG